MMNVYPIHVFRQNILEVVMMIRYSHRRTEGWGCLCLGYLNTPLLKGVLRECFNTPPLETCPL